MQDMEATGEDSDLHHHGSRAAHTQPNEAARSIGGAGIRKRAASASSARGGGAGPSASSSTRRARTGWQPSATDVRRPRGHTIEQVSSVGLRMFQVVFILIAAIALAAGAAYVLTPRKKEEEEGRSSVHPCQACTLLTREPLLSSAAVSLCLLSGGHHAHRWPTRHRCARDHQTGRHGGPVLSQLVRSARFDLSSFSSPSLLSAPLPSALSALCSLRCRSNHPY